MSGYTRRTGFGFLRLAHARRLEEEIAATIGREVPMISDPPGFRLGDLLPGFGYGRCFRCHRPWWACAPQVVEIGAGCGQFALCVGCWRRASCGERVEAHRWVSVQTCPGDVDKILEMVWRESW